MTVQGSAVQSVAQAHAELRARSDIQFDMSVTRPPEPPAWMRWLARQLEHLSPFMPVIFWTCVALGAAIILYLLVRTFWRGRPSREAAAGPIEDDTAWRPTGKVARALLAEADAMAAQGRFEEAARLLLHRSLEDIQRHRPRLLRPSLTSREIGRAGAMPPLVRTAFVAMAAPVERSLFGGRRLERPDWEEARAAYGAFALPGAWK